MATIIPTNVAAGISGKTSRNSDIYYRTNRRTGKVTAVKRDEKRYHKNNSPAQRDCQAGFRALQKVVDDWIAEQRLNPTPQFYAAMADFNAQHEVPYFRSYLHQHATEYGIV